MHTKKKSLNSGTCSICIKPISIGVISSNVLCGILMFALTFIFVKSSSPPSNLTGLIMITLSGICSFVGGYLATKTSKEKGLIYGLLCSFIMFVFIFIASLIVVRKPLSWITLSRLLVMLTFGGFGGIVGGNRYLNHQ